MSYEQHGDTGTRLYRIWKSMKCRCSNTSHPTFKHYGARGITVTDEWENSYSAFKQWAMSHGYSDDLELERVDVNGEYSPANCKWVSHYEQTLNRRDTLYITLGNVTTRLRDFCLAHSISINTVNNWRHQNALEEKLSERVGCQVYITGGKKEVVDV